MYIVSDAALYRFDAYAGWPSVTWREVYPNSGIHKPGQSGPGSGTTPDVIGSKYVAIADNADPLQVVVYKRAKTVTGSRLVCAQPVFKPGAGATDNSLITAGRSIIVENNYGYSGLMATMDGKTTEPGFERVDIDADGRGCRTVWRNDERAPSVVPKVSLATGLVYAYTKPPTAGTTDAWYFTAIDFRTGRDDLQAARWNRPRLQQQLGSGHAGTRRHRLRRHPGRAGAAARPVGPLETAVIERRS